MGKQSHGIKSRFQKQLVTLGKNIRRVREGKGFTQEFVSFNAGINFSTINGIENGRLNPTAATLYAIAEAMKVSVKEFIE